jgi:site-specific recombinase XerD
MSQIQACNIEELLERFKKFLEERLKLGKPLEPKHPTIGSQSTIQTYLEVARRFLTNMTLQHSLPLNEDVAREFLAIYRKRGAKPRTLLVIFSALKNLYHCMGWSWSISHREVITEDVNVFVELPYLTREEIDKVLEYAEHIAEEKRCYRDVVLLYLLANAMRPEDIRRLKISNLEKKTMKDEDGNEHDAYIISYIPCKRGRHRVVILGRKASLWMERWISFLEEVAREVYMKRARKKLDEIEFKAIFDEYPLFPQYITAKTDRIIWKVAKATPKPITTVRIRQIIKPYIVGALGREEESYQKSIPYAFRRGVVVELLKEHQPHTISKWMGWKDLRMPLVYDKERLVEVAEKFIITR